MASNVVLSFRPRNEMLADYEIILEWCAQNGYPFSAVFNAFIPAIAYSLQHDSFVDDNDHKLYIRADFGDVPVTRTSTLRFK